LPGCEERKKKEVEEVEVERMMSEKTNAFRRRLTMIALRLLLFLLLPLSYPRFAHIIKPGDVLVLGEELGRRLLLQVFRLARLGRHGVCWMIRWSFVEFFFFLFSGLSGSPPALRARSSPLEQKLELVCSRGRGIGADGTRKATRSERVCVSRSLARLFFEKSEI